MITWSREVKRLKRVCEKSVENAMVLFVSGLEVIEEENTRSINGEEYMVYIIYKFVYQWNEQKSK